MFLKHFKKSGFYHEICTVYCKTVRKEFFVMCFSVVVFVRSKIHNLQVSLPVSNNLHQYKNPDSLNKES